MSRNAVVRIVSILALCAGGTLALSPPAAAMRKPAFPTGSFKSTCFDTAYKPDSNYGTIRAKCTPKSGLPQPTELIVKGCRPGSVTNDDGHLKCDFDQATYDEYIVLLNEDALAAAAALVMGAPGSDADKARWMVPGYEAGATTAKLEGGTLQFTDAMGILKRYLVEKATAGERQAVIQAAFRQVYGPGLMIHSDIDYMGQMAAGKAWYATIVEAERQYRDSSKPAGGKPAPITPIG